MTPVRRDLPSGTVTFLFTDVEGSTRLLHELGVQAYAEALAEHRRLLREAFASHGGVEVDTQGDAFFVAFPTAPDALAAAAEAQSALVTGPIRVRMGIHTGTPHLASEGYVGVDVHRAARIAAAGHGRQVLVSASTASLVEAELLDLGEHRLKDLSAAERLFQLGDGEFPPLKTLYRTNLPIPATPFLGRERELGKVAELLAREDVRLLTLTGPGGTGKTRLALQAAGEAVAAFPDGVFWVGLASLRDAALVLPEMAQALQAKRELQEEIADKRLLVLLDNFEHVLEAAGRLSELVARCTNLTLLVTSREVLHLAGEREYAVPALAEDEAVSLFRARAALAEPEDVVRAICARLDFLPLAVELAAARTKVLRPAKLLERLEQTLPLLTGGPRDADERQRTLRATIEWSHDLLTPEEQRLFTRLSVFAGGCTLDAAENVCDADLDTLQSLVEKSLLSHSDSRFWMLETIREYAVERLEQSGEAEELRRRHAGWTLELAETVDPHDEGSHERTWHDLLDSEHDNFRAALRWSIVGGEPELGLRIACGLAQFWIRRDHAPEGGRWLDELLKVAEAPDGVWAVALRARGRLALRQGDAEQAIHWLDAAVALCRRLGDDRELAFSLDSLGLALVVQGALEEAAPLQGESLELFERVADREGLRRAHKHLGEAALARGQPERAQSLLERSLALALELGNAYAVEATLHSLGDALLEQGALDRAADRYREALTHAAERGAGALAYACFQGLACVAVQYGKVERAGRLWGAAEEGTRGLGFELRYFEHARYGRFLEGVNRTAFASGAAAGRALAFNEAVAYALAAVN